MGHRIIPKMNVCEMSEEMLAKIRQHRMSVSAEVYSENASTRYKYPFYPKEPSQHEQITTAIKKCFLFSSVDEKHLKILVDAFKFSEFQDKTVIIRQGEPGDKLYLIYEGSVRVTKLINGKDEFMCDVKPGEIFGELALMYDAPRAATVTATGRVKTWELGRECFNHLVRKAAIKKRQMYGSFISKISLFENIDDYEKLKLVDSLQIFDIPGGENIISQGDSDDRLFMIVEGKAIAYKDGIEIKRYSEGDYFGELALLKGAKRAATVKALDNVKVATLNRARCNNILGPIEPIVKQNIEKYKHALVDAGINPNFLDNY